MPRRTLAQALAETTAMRTFRAPGRRRVSRAKREAIAPRDPSQALSAYSGTMRTYTTRVTARVEKLILNRLPVMGSGDPLDLAALEEGLTALEAELDVLAGRSRRSSLAAARRASNHARVEAGRILNVVLPKADPRVAVTVEEFATLGVDRLRRAGRAQVEQIRKAIRAHVEGQSLRADISRALWVSRVRSQAIARDQVYGLHTRVIRDWSLAIGSDQYTWHTRHDERVRAGHQRLDGRVFAWSDPPHTGRREGRNHPGHPPNCRCTAIPVEVLR